MAITDAQNRPSLAQSLAGAAATTVSTDSIDLLSANRNIGRTGYPPRAQTIVSTLAAGGTSVQVQLITSASSTLSSPTVIATGPVVLTATAVAGAELLDVPIPGTAQRYLGFQYTTIGVMTTLAVTSHILAETDNQPYITSNTGL